MKSKFGISFFSIVFVGCVGANPNESAVEQLGLYPIGSSPTEFTEFSSTDCIGQVPRLSDCSAVGKSGLNYTFFDGALSRVSAKSDSIVGKTDLPGGVEFGDGIDDAAAKLVDRGVKFDRVVLPGSIVYSSDFVLKSAAGTHYSLELHSNEAGLLVEVIERTDF